jgi:hypothetical protein
VVSARGFNGTVFDILGFLGLMFDGRVPVRLLGRHTLADALEGDRKSSLVPYYRKESEGRGKYENRCVFSREAKWFTVAQEIVEKEIFFCLKPGRKRKTSSIEFFGSSRVHGMGTVVLKCRGEFRTVGSTLAVV